jgi:hypothetical protein
VHRVTGTVNFATEQGLGLQARAFIRHGVIDRILVARHPVYDNHPEWYTPEQSIGTAGELLGACERLIFMEHVFGLGNLVTRARELGVQTVLVTHYEFTGNLPNELQFDAVVAPSEEDLAHYLGATRLNIPVDVPWKQRREARVFVHNAGHGGVKGRNGTQELLAAMAHVKSPLKLIVRVQPHAHQQGFHSSDPRVEIRVGSAPYETLFDEGDVFVLPDKFGGSFLSMQEAYAAGMPVMASDRTNNRWLPNEFLIPVERYADDHIRIPIASAVINPKSIAEKLDEMYGRNISEASLSGREWARVNSWDALRRAYEAL